MSTLNLIKFIREEQSFLSKDTTSEVSFLRIIYVDSWSGSACTEYVKEFLIPKIFKKDLNCVGIYVLSREEIKEILAEENSKNQELQARLADACEDPFCKLTDHVEDVVDETKYCLALSYWL